MSPFINGVVLAGGKGRRMGEKQKSQLLLGGQPLVQHVINQVKPQVNKLLINANSGLSFFKSTSLPVRSDSCEGHLGPLAGILTAMEWTAREYPKIDYILSAPVDNPFLPNDLVSELMAAKKGKNADIAVASSGSNVHYTVGIWPVEQKDRLRSALLIEKVRRVEKWANRHKLAIVDFGVGKIDPFTNINSPRCLAAAASLLRN